MACRSGGKWLRDQDAIAHPAGTPFEPAAWKTEGVAASRCRFGSLSHAGLPNERRPRVLGACGFTRPQVLGAYEYATHQSQNWTRPSRSGRRSWARELGPLSFASAAPRCPLMKARSPSPRLLPRKDAHRNPTRAFVLEVGPCAHHPKVVCATTLKAPSSVRAWRQGNGRWRPAWRCRADSNRRCSCRGPVPARHSS